jgi:uncharacterized membrane protein YgcG
MQRLFSIHGATSMRILVLVSSILLALPAAADAQRLLHWSNFDVTAGLDAAGRLRVSERQTMVFDGDWNGGERTFRLGFAQEITIHGIYRVDPETGEEVRLQLGGLDQVDHWDWATGETLRWRSRLPSDPPFDHRTLIYRLDYTLTGVVVRRGGGYELAHDFAFADRPGEVERFTLDLELDPAWRPRSQLAHSLELRSLPPGQGVVVSAELDYSGAEAPEFVASTVRLEVRAALFALSLAALAILFLRFRRHESERGRYEASDVPDPIDRAYLDEHLLHRRAEAVGAFWDRKIGPPEVAATLARLVAEGKLKSEVLVDDGWLKRKVLSLELLVERGEFRGYERKLIDKLFFGGRTRTDTDVVQAHYSGKGFDPTAVIRPSLEKRLDQVFGRRPDKPSSKPVWLLFAAAVAALVLEGVTRGESALVVLALLLLTAVPALVFGAILAYRYRKRSLGLGAASLGFLVPLALMTAAIVLGVFAEDLWGLAIRAFFPGIFGILALALAPAAVASLCFHLAATRDAADAVRERRRLAVIRRFLAAELRRPQPRLEDAWFPYLLAFGLDRQVDRWFKSFGGASSAYSTTHSTASFGSSAGSPSWTGGGGTFGGAGASAGWAAAATGLAAGVATPSSSSGGGGGGGSFSGGGGGGGW